MKSIKFLIMLLITASVINVGYAALPITMQMQGFLTPKVEKKINKFELQSFAVEQIQAFEILLKKEQPLVKTNKIHEEFLWHSAEKNKFIFTMPYIYKYNTLNININNNVKYFKNQKDFFYRKMFNYFNTSNTKYIWRNYYAT